MMMQHFAVADDTVEVGADLYSLDTDASAAAAAAAKAASAPAAKQSVTETSDPAVANNGMAPLITNDASSMLGGGRMPSIKFLGKAGWAARRNPGKEMEGDGEGEGLHVDVGFDPMFGRPPVSEDEMEALLSGGAEFAPTVLKGSYGAQFGT